MRKNASVSNRVICILIAVALVVIAAILPTPEQLTFEGKMALVLILSSIILWIFEPIPLAVSALALMIALPVFGIMDYQGVWASFISSVIFFTIASFGISAALLKTRLPAIIASLIIRRTQKRPRLFILLFMCITAFISLFISDLACVAMMTAIAVSSFLVYHKVPKEKSNFGKTLMIGIAWAATGGGQAFLTGSSLYVMAVNMVDDMTGIRVTFLDWFLINLPIALVLILVAWGSLMIIFKPEPISDDTIKAIQEQAVKSKKLGALDIKVMVIVIATMIAWTATTWTGWDLTAITVLSLIIFFLPGIDVLKWGEFTAAVSWSIVILQGAVQSIAAGIRDQGAATWVLGSTIGKIGAGTTLSLVVITAFIAPLLRFFVPVGPAFVAICLLPLADMAQAVGISAAAFAIIIGTNAGTTFLLGIDTATILTHSAGYWKMGDILKAGIAPTIAMMLCHAFFVPPMLALLGY